MRKEIENRRSIDTVERERERERERATIKEIGFINYAKKSTMYINIKRRIDFLKEKEKLNLLRESLSFL